MSSEYLPEGFFVDIDREGRAVTTRELHEARDMALDRPGAWVRVGDTRRLMKDPSAWCSEVNTGKKRALQSPFGHFEAAWWTEDERPDGTGCREYGKALRYILDVS